VYCLVRQGVEKLPAPLVPETPLLHPASLTLVSRSLFSRSHSHTSIVASWPRLISQRLRLRGTFWAGHRDIIAPRQRIDERPRVPVPGHTWRSFYVFSLKCNQFANVFHPEIDIKGKQYYFFTFCYCFSVFYRVITLLKIKITNYLEFFCKFSFF